VTHTGVEAEEIEAAAFVERWDDVARRAAGRIAGRNADEAPAELRELLVIWLDGDPYALPIERVREIVRLRPITPVPRVPEAVRGVISLRGEIVQVLDLRRRLGLPPADLAGGGRRQRIVVLHGEDGQLAGVLVDRVSEVLRTPADALRAPAAREADTVTALVPHGERFASLFDVDRLLELGRRAERSAAS
jgi:purine-binding chemotaxis protein CheW